MKHAGRHSMWICALIMQYDKHTLLVHVNYSLHSLAKDNLILPMDYRECKGSKGRRRRRRRRGKREEASGLTLPNHSAVLFRVPGDEAKPKTH